MKNHEKSKFPKFDLGIYLNYPRNGLYRYFGDLKHFPGRSRIFRAKKKILRNGHFMRKYQNSTLQGPPKSRTEWLLIIFNEIKLYYYAF